MGIIYEVNLVIDASIADQYGAWLHEHVKEILKLNGFLSAEIFIRDPKDEGGQPNSNEVLWTVQYRLKDRDAMDNYLNNYAASMRQDGINRFGDKFKATRRILQTTHVFP